MQLVNEFVVPRPIDQTWDVLTDVERIAPAMPGAQLTDHVDDAYHGKVKVKVGPVTAQYAGIAKFKELDREKHHMVLEATGKESSGRGRASALVTADLSSEGDQTRVKVVTDLTISGPLAQFGRGAIAEVSSRLLGQFVSNLESMVLANEPAPSTAESGGTPTDAAGGSGASGAATSGTGGAPATSAGDGSSGQAAGAAEGPTATSASPATPAAPQTTASPSTSAQPRPGAYQSQQREPASAEVNLLRVAGWPILKRLIPVIIVIVVIIVLIVVFA